jgi:hypothetical protein
MSFSNKGGLKTAIQTWLARVDSRISANADDMISLCEAKLNRDLPLRVMWTNTTLTGTINLSTVSLPSDYLEPQSLFLTTFGVQTRLGKFMEGEYPISTTNGVPGAWAIAGSNIQLDVPCDQAHTFIFRYRQRFNLASDSDTNHLLTNHPDVYLFCALLEAESLSKDVTQKWIALWQGRAKEAMDSVAELDARSALIADLRVDPAIRTPPAFNINTG